MGAERVTVGFIHPGETSGWFAHSLAATALREGRGKGRIKHIIHVESSPRIAEGRSQVVDGFLSDTDDLWLLMIDADMDWSWDTFDVLARHADPETVPIIGGLCFAGGRQGQAEGAKTNIYPTIYRWVKDDNGVLNTEFVPDYPRDELIPVGATGAAFLLVHRSVFRKLRKAYEKDASGFPNPYPWFAEMVYQGRPMGEDITFCMRAQGAGYPIHVHTGAFVRHRKSFMLDQELYDQVHGQ